MGRKIGRTRQQEDLHPERGVGAVEWSQWCEDTTKFNDLQATQQQDVPTEGVVGIDGQM